MMRAVSLTSEDSGDYRREGGKADLEILNQSLQPVSGTWLTGTCSEETLWIQKPQALKFKPLCSVTLLDLLNTIVTGVHLPEKAVIKYEQLHELQPCVLVNILHVWWALYLHIHLTLRGSDIFEKVCISTKHVDIFFLDFNP